MKIFRLLSEWFTVPFLMPNAQRSVSSSLEFAPCESFGFSTKSPQAFFYINGQGECGDSQEFVSNENPCGEAINQQPGGEVWRVYFYDDERD
ncbi:hypothetical protein R6242_19515 [Iodobacter sp. CM08]|uniref:hypothetical protein n=1 Tax=Iodobacter sp. CM08 TaxID=3085902 RepID=UPI0029829617|nr:hypothetical protein [Iodobacter sp. CM08]MDW5418761.1 hypothetical protein [Iodobacter sp. CM08]